MFRRDLIPVCIGILLLSGMFLLGQDTWPPPCTDNDGDGYGAPASESCTHPALDCDDDNPDVNPGATERSYGGTRCVDGVDNDCDGWVDMADSGCWQCSTPVDCDDAYPCTDDDCVDHACVYVNNAPPCDDGNECTSNDRFCEGVCSGMWIQGCCNNNADCDPHECPWSYCVAGRCEPTVPGGWPCDDGNPCTINQCSMHGGMCIIVTYIPGCCQTEADCEDGNPCTDDACVNHACVHGNNENPCDDGNVCTTGDTCTSGYCAGSPPLECEDDGNACTDDFCDPIQGCLHWCNASGPADPCCEENPSCIESQACSPILVGSLLPDTGITFCYNEAGAIECPSEGEPFYGQDAQYSANPMGYTDHGNGAVTDDVTGLMWQKCSAGLSGPDCSAGTVERMAWEDAIAYCESLDLAGQTDWRLPTRYELPSIVDYGRSKPAIDTTVFPGTVFPGYLEDNYWSSSTLAGLDDYVWCVSFRWGASGYLYKEYVTDSVRCVRGETVPQSFSANGDGTVKDNTSGLVWQQEMDEQTKDWDSALAYCQALDLGGSTGWRLPDIRELDSIVDISRRSPAIDTTVFLGAGSRALWSSSTYSLDPSLGLIVDFYAGETEFVSKTYHRYVICVR